jgi:small subunit ribosomal protein S12
MATLVQGARRSHDYKKYYKKFNLSRVPALQKRPQVKGIVRKISNMSPKKPNSAVRIVAKVNLTNGLRITGRMPGIGYLCGKYNRVLVNGGRANDLPGVGYSLVRGVFDFSPVIFKRKRRSIYGVARPDGYTKHVKRSLRITK